MTKIEHHEQDIIAQDATREACVIEGMEVRLAREKSLLDASRKHRQEFRSECELFLQAKQIAKEMRKHTAAQREEIKTLKAQADKLYVAGNPELAAKLERQSEVVSGLAQEIKARRQNAQQMFLRFV